MLTMLLMVGWITAYQTLGLPSAAPLPFSAAGLQGLAAYLRGDYAIAARAYRLASHGRLDTSYVDDRAGMWALHRGHTAAAERRANTTLALVPSASEPLLTLGELALDRGDAGGAITYFNAVLGRYPDHVDALLLSAVARGRLGDADRAIATIHRALRHGTAGTRPTIYLRILEIAGDLARRPRPPLCLLAHYHRYLRIFDERQGALALAYAERAVAAADHPADAWLAMGIMYDKRHRPLLALHAFEQAIAFDPRHAEALRWAAVEAGQLSDHLLEYRMARAALEAAPDDIFYVAPAERIVMRRFGDGRTMTALLRMALERNPASAAVHDAQARALTALGEHERAEDHRRRAAELRRGSAP